MRQGGMVPKGHDSGVYWVRANANQKGGSSEPSLKNLAIVFFVILFLICAVV